MHKSEIDTPSTFQENFSPNMIGDNIALKIMEKHDVDDIKIMLPKYNETPLNPMLQKRIMRPNHHSIWQRNASLFGEFSILIFPIFMQIKPKAEQNEPHVAKSNANTYKKNASVF